MWWLIGLGAVVLVIVLLAMLLTRRGVTYLDSTESWPTDGSAPGSRDWPHDHGT